MIFFLIGLLLFVIALFIIQGLPGFSSVQTSLVITANVLLPLLAILLVVPIVRKRMPGIELRANQAVVGLLYTLFVVLFAICAYMVIGLFSYESRVIAGLILIILGGLLSPFIYARMRSEIHWRLLGIPERSDRLAQTVANKIVTSMELQQLSELWKTELMPALMVRQAALLGLDKQGRAHSLVLYGVEKTDLPSPQELSSILEDAGRYRPVPDEDQTQVCSWVRLVLPLQIENRKIAVCLFGRRDPDDFYSAEELPALGAIMNQIALALYNIEQTAQLHAFHRSNIQRHEQQQISLARDLHDDVLNQMGLIYMNTGIADYPGDFQDAYQKVIDRVRNIVNGLRPPMIEYGLHYSLNSLVDDLSEQVSRAAIELQFSHDQNTLPRYPQEVEVQLYRISQEACLNALRHAANCHLTLSVRLENKQVELSIRDDGPGFDAGEDLDFTYLLNNHHFGLANMYERAQIIGAHLKIHSTPGRGTEVYVLWENPEMKNG